jgi:glycosyltransferase involved in cell wall biosynthesis
MKSISVVVPARNEEKLLPRCLSALRQQQFEDFEIIVVDSASTDHTQQVARSFGARVIHLEEPGIARARQAGFDAAAGGIIVSTDADSVVPSNWIEKLTSPLYDSEVVGVFGPVHVGGEGIWAGLSTSLFPLFQGVNLRLGKPLFSGQNFAVRKAAFVEAGGFAIRGSYPEVAEDVQLALKLKHEGRIVFLRDLTVQTSARRFQGIHGLHYVGYHIGVYFNVCWFSKAR